MRLLMGNKASFRVYVYCNSMVHIMIQNAALVNFIFLLEIHKEKYLHLNFFQFSFEIFSIH